MQVKRLGGWLLPFFSGEEVGKAKPVWQFGHPTVHWVSPRWLLFFALFATVGRSQGRASVDPQTSNPPTVAPSVGTLTHFIGLPVNRISYEGVAAERLRPIPDHLAQRIGVPLSRENLAESLHQLFATGLFETIRADASREENGVAIVFKGEPRFFVGTVKVYGAKGATMNAQLEHASRLLAGTRFTKDRAERAVSLMHQALADNGFNEPVIDLQPDGAPR